MKLRKDRMSLESAVQSRREVLGSLLPQVNASSSMAYNLRKTTVAMPNFVNSMLPESMRDPSTPKYMTVTMGMDYNASIGATLTQQIVNLSLFNALRMAETAEKMSAVGHEINREELISQTATLYCTIQILSYVMQCFEQSISLMDRTLGILEVSGDNGMLRPLDLKQVRVSRANLEAERESMSQALGIQMNLLKLQMGFPMDMDLELQTPGLDEMEEMISRAAGEMPDPDRLLPFRMLKTQQKMLELQYKSAVSEALPTISLSANYTMNYMGDDFKGETFRHFPVSMVSLNLRMPIFTGLSKTAKVKKADIERKKSVLDERMLIQSLSMAHSNAMHSLEQNLKTMESQRLNRELAREVFEMVEGNYREGIASLSDLLNANSSLVRSQMSYANALSGCVKAYVELKKANGTLDELCM